MKKFKLSIFLTSIALSSLLIGCSSSKKNGSLEESSLGGVTDQDLETDQSRFGAGNIPNASESSQFPDIHFDYDSSAVKKEDYEIIKSNAKALVADVSLSMEVEGHCDKRGTAEYNLALGENRAKAVAAMLVNFGAKAEQLSTISYGEEIPIDPKENEEAYAKNRRVHFAVFRKKK